MSLKYTKTIIIIIFIGICIVKKIYENLCKNPMGAFHKPHMFGELNESNVSYSCYSHDAFLDT